MKKDSISNKLTELFDLYKSGALTQEEYESLKKQIIEESGVGEIKKESIQKPKDTFVPDEPFKEKRHKPENLIISDKPVKEIIQEPKSTIILDKPVKEKKRREILLLAVIGGLCIAAFVIFKLTNVSINSGVKDLNEQIVKDIEGNVYHTVKIGSQVWMVENLKTSHFNDGTPIPLDTESESWRNLKTPAYCWYNNDETNYKNTYGALYNWYAVNTNKLCPAGWHVPSDSDWKVLTEYLSNNGFSSQGNGEDIGKSLAHTSGWNYSNAFGSVGNNQSYNNKSGFTAFASGIRFSNGEFRHSRQNAKWWSSTETTGKTAQIRFISWNDGIVSSFSNGKQNGFSVRCVKNNEDNNVEIINKNKPKGNEVQETTNNAPIAAVEKNNNNVQNVKRDPKRKDIANVFWDSNYTLFCLLTDEPIFSDSDEIYDIWYSSNEDPKPYHQKFTKNELRNHLYYKFKDYESCKKWCDARNQAK